MKVGEIARQTGVTVRTLHHYEKLGLLVPSHRTESNHRMYTLQDLVRLQQILSLRDIGFSLEEVQACLDSPRTSVDFVLEQHLQHLQKEASRIGDLTELIRKLREELSTTGQCSMEQLTETIHRTKMMEKYFTEEQQEKLRIRREELGEDGMQQGQADWAELMPKLRSAADNQLDPESEEARDLMRTFHRLMQAFSGGDEDIQHAVHDMYEQDPNVASQHGWVMDDAMKAFLHAAWAAEFGAHEG